MAGLAYKKRLMRELKALRQNPPELFVARPLDSNIREWHYVVYGLKDCAYEGGVYHGKLVFPEQYPMKPPAIYMLTPNGRFQTGTRLCLSISDFHPETWNPAWTVESILKGLISFMLDEAPTAGSISASTFERKEYARKSLLHNLKNDKFQELFPQVTEEIKKILRQRHSNRQAQTPVSSTQTVEFSTTNTLVATGVLVAIFAAVISNIWADVAT
eukprot:TRINITY_DN12498_c0_g2_i10.p2 TRINITY_DN12498_c0_g2~~TRINITY_DN12498_c0_g2_i10.p2  ORF type:complete len:215 (+),score=11.31 TRINITY_DN12498_c0_g2_i10:808-1452(+)